ncbi:sigma-70 family RNA polymerase sigma factor [Phycisphaerales bacterium AB-hyl4]|uniref:Sigma-70 family RNA polymerase sigma factor n=1 Tax=Natronomicrosphaera hydrolytica TaxID=3242702 RepID=A0ABV4U929_9BACT
MIATAPTRRRIRRTREQVDHEAELWRRYTHRRTLTNRNALVACYKRFAWHLIRQYEQGGHLPPQLTGDDVSGAVMAALVWCVERFRPNSGAVFTTFARRRLQGAIIDEQRRWGGRWMDIAGSVAGWHT